jgi:cell shape-determining protein MreD
VSDNGRISLIFLLNLMLYFLIGEMNFLVGKYAVHLHLDALLILFFGIYLSRLSSLVCSALLGFLADAMHPSPVGTYVVGYLFLWVFFVWFHHRIRRQNKTHVRALAASGQAIWLVYLSIAFGLNQLDQPSYWHRVAFDLSLSVAIVYALAWPWCNIQKRLLYTLGWDLEAQMPKM